MHFSDFDNSRLQSQLSGERFLVTYELFGSEAACRTAAEEICVEQSVEFPTVVLPPGEIPGQILGPFKNLFFVHPAASSDVR